MKTFTTLVPISLAALAIASPLGDRAVFQRHNGTPNRNARRYILQSRVNAPPACAALTISNTTASPNFTNATIPLSKASISTNQRNVTAPLTNTTSVVGNTTSTNNSTTNVNTPLSTTSTDNSTSAANSRTPSRQSRSHWRRIEQTDLPEVARSWQVLCLVSGGDIFTNDPCVRLAGLNGISALLADADPCAQQDNADAMITFAKSAGVNNTDELIANAIAYRQHPRSSTSILGVVPSTMYCQKAPQNPELVGVVNEQLDGVEPGIYGSPNIPLTPFGAPGTCPFGQEPDVTTCTCVDTATTDDPTSTGVSVNTNTTATDTSFANTTATSVSASGTGTNLATVLTSTTSVAASRVTSSARSTASVTFGLSTASAASARTSTATAPSKTSTFVASSASSATSGPNFQPDDISGNVNDING